MTADVSDAKSDSVDAALRLEKKRKCKKKKMRKFKEYNECYKPNARQRVDSIAGIQAATVALVSVNVSKTSTNNTP